MFHGELSKSLARA